MSANNEQKQESTVEEKTVIAYQHRCGFCGSTEPLISYEAMYGPGAVGYDCCSDCGGV